MAVRGGAVVAVLVVALALSSSWDTASAQFFQKRKAKQPPQKSKPGNPGQVPPDRSKFTTVVANRYHKRDYEITCTTDYGAACYVKCPVGHQTAVYAGGELLCGEVDEREKANELNTGIWCCKTATFSDALY